MKKAKTSKTATELRPQLNLGEVLTGIEKRLFEFERNQASKDQVEIRIPEADFMRFAKQNGEGACAKLPSNISLNQAVAVATPSKTPFEGQIPKLLQELQFAQDYIHNRLDDLSKKLEPILGPSNPSAPTTGLNGPGSSCAAGDSLQLRLNTAQGIASRINDLIERLAL